MLSESMFRGFELLILSVGMLFVFVACLQFIVKGISRFVAQYELRHPALVPVRLPVNRVERERARVAAITAAVYRHRARFR